MILCDELPKVWINKLFKSQYWPFSNVIENNKNIPISLG